MRHVGMSRESERTWPTRCVLLRIGPIGRGKVSAQALRYLWMVCRAVLPFPHGEVRARERSFSEFKDAAIVGQHE